MPLVKDSPARVLRGYLIGVGVVFNVPAGTTRPVDWTAYLKRRTKNTVDNAVFIINTSPMPDGRYMKTGESVEHPGIQITVRALDAEAAYIKCKAIEAWLTQDLGRTIVTISEGKPDERSYLVHSFTVTSGVTYIGNEEESERELYTLNGLLTLEEIVE